MLFSPYMRRLCVLVSAFVYGDNLPYDYGGPYQSYDYVGADKAGTFQFRNGMGCA